MHISALSLCFIESLGMYLEPQPRSTVMPHSWQVASSERSAETPEGVSLLNPKIFVVL